MTKLSRKKLARAFIKLLDRYPAGQAVAALAAELTRQRQGQAVDLLVQEIFRQLLDERHYLDASVVSALPLPRDVANSIVAMLKEKTGATHVHLRERIDRNLLGGCFIRTPVFEIDATVSGALSKL